MSGVKKRRKRRKAGGICNSPDDRDSLEKKGVPTVKKQVLRRGGPTEPPKVHLRGMRGARRNPARKPYQMKKRKVRQQGGGESLAKG